VTVWIIDRGLQTCSDSNHTGREGDTVENVSLESSGGIIGVTLKMLRFYFESLMTLACFGKLIIFLFKLRIRYLLIEFINRFLVENKTPIFFSPT